jgi:hypothetical protein
MVTPKPKWNLQAKDQEGNDTSAKVSDEFEAFLRFTRLDEIAPRRISFLLLLVAFAITKAGRINPAMIASEIEALENGKPTGLKPPIQNRYPPLKGLWHKHYMQSGIASLALNVQNALNKYGIPSVEQKVREAEQAGETRYFSAEDVQMVANDVVHGNLARRRQAQQLTGEWIVFAKHEGQNYYLGLATHNESHENLRQQIDAICCREFPFLEKLLADAAKSG